MGIGDGFGAGVALVEDGAVRFAVSEERLSRIKNHSGYYHGFPDRSIEVALRILTIRNFLGLELGAGPSRRRAHGAAGHEYWESKTGAQLLPSGKASGNMVGWVERRETHHGPRRHYEHIDQPV